MSLHFLDTFLSFSFLITLNLEWGFNEYCVMGLVDFFFGVFAFYPLKIMIWVCIFLILSSFFFCLFFITTQRMCKWGVYLCCIIGLHFLTCFYVSVKVLGIVCELF